MFILLFILSTLTGFQLSDVNCLFSYTSTVKVRSKSGQGQVKSKLKSSQVKVAYCTHIQVYLVVKHSNTNMKFFIFTVFIGFLMLAPIGATATATARARVPQYGLESVEGFCEGWGELDQLSDISSQILNVKFPYMGPIRVSWTL